MPLSEFREKLGVEETEYKAMNHFKARVLDVAIKQINEHTDITVKYEQHKRGRSISGFSFTFTQKNTAKTLPKNPKRTPITKAEAEKLANPGESWYDLVNRLKGEYVITDL